ncbi:cupin domain-containing protein [Maledivibacter halophilus]|uniref:Cupin domain protein n=1 Tax=Maledivibacter halophilus TaxID=36842 RepID=A0A1T5MRU4_9FIRM|nr:cupin domain-containing protein [Maledivibacter halophilus]SKC90947.1 Cupin domain protein [Maledivibacter halophilus]
MVKIISEKEISPDIFRGYEMIEAFKESKNIIKMGKAVIKSGTRIPENGFGVHDADEFSYIIKGCVESVTKEEEKTTVKAGDFSYIPAGEKHWCKNTTDKDCELIWFLIKKD